MAFYDERKKGIFNVAGVGDRSGNDGSSMYAAGKVDADGKYVRSPAYINFYSLNSEKRLSFKAFLDSFSISLNNEYGIEDTSGVKIVVKGISLFTYNITLNVPSFSVNESMNNLAKFQDLERMISIDKTKYQTELTAGKTFIDPKLYINFSNLIQDGSFDCRLHDVKYPGNDTANLHCIIKTLSFSPDLEAGFFEYNNNLMPKFYTLSLDIAPYLTSTNGSLVINGFNSDGYWGRTAKQLENEKSNDIATKSQAYKTIKYWPFGFKVANGSYGGSLNIKTINSFPNTVANNDGTDTYASNKRALLAISSSDEKINKWVVFKAFLESFKYDKSIGYEDVKSKSASDTGILFVNSLGKEYDFSFKINVPADSVNEAINNISKINILYRLCLDYVPSAASDDKKTFKKGNVFISLSNLIHNPDKSTTPSSFPDSKTVIDNGLKCVLNSVNFEIDTDMGFFEYQGGFLPKMFSLDFSAKLIDVKNYGATLNESGELSTNDSSRWPFNMDYI